LLLALGIQGVACGSSSNKGSGDSGLPTLGDGDGDGDGDAGSNKPGDGDGDSGASPGDGDGDSGVSSGDGDGGAPASGCVQTPKNPSDFLKLCAPDSVARVKFDTSKLPAAYRNGNLPPITN
jgi:hypothetical protein